MTHIGRRTKRAGIAMTGVMAVGMMFASYAWACVSVASLEFNPGSAKSGATVSAKASQFQADPSYSPVEVHWGSAQGPLLYSGRPLPYSDMTFKFTVPQATPGTYAIVATQTDSSGAPAWGTPARATLTIPGAAVAAAPTNTPEAGRTVTVYQQHVAAPGAATTASATSRPATPIEIQEAITTKVVPGSSRSATYTPLNAQRASSSAPSTAGMALAAVGVMALITAGAAALIVRSASPAISRRG